MNIKVLAIAGTAGVGKDLFLKLLNQRLDKKLEQFKRFAFADVLKLELREPIRTLYNIDVFECSKEEKELVRPFMVFHGAFRRKQSNGDYWIKKVEKQIKLENPKNLAITDVRYPNEAKWVKDKLGGKVIWIQKMMPNGSWVGPANQEEEANTLPVKKMADFVITWEHRNVTNKNKQLDYFIPIIDSFIKKIGVPLC